MKTGTQRALATLLLSWALFLGDVPAALAEATEASAGPTAPAILFQDVRVFDGRSSQLSLPMNVLVRGRIIERISAAPLEAADAGSALTRIEGNGRTLMPGLIDNHWHTMLARPTPAQSIEDDIGYLNLLAGVEAEATLMRGFTTVRDLGGPSFGLKRAIDEGLVVGPRIYPCGGVITITGGWRTSS